MPHQSDRITIGKQLKRFIELNISDSKSSSLSDNDLEMLDLLNIDDESDPSSRDSDRDLDLFDKCDSEGDDEIGDLTSLMDVVEQSYIYESEGWEKSSKFLYKYFLDLPEELFHQLTQMNKRSYMCLLDMICEHRVFHNNSPYPQALVFVQLADILFQILNYRQTGPYELITLWPHRASSQK
ncbi:hypothetical protein R1sor_007111 [Riccia sorocarpa]|uniref:PiggyBac transposable element-derived protein domain-containing protein n=1 Tax=Riccia sorocarpa TaxID=122646 RepID=A0ABD3HT62_9MARC